MAGKGNEVKVGIMIVATVIILGLFLFAIFGIEFGKETKSYEILLSYVGGIKNGTVVKYGGLDVGQVTNITLPDKDHIQIHLTLQVDAKTPVRVNSEAFVSSVGVMSERHIEITPGSPDEDLLPPGSLIESKEVQSIMQMAESFGEVNSQIKELLTRIGNMFADENQNSFASMMKNMNNLIQELQERSLKATESFEVLSTELTDLTREISGFMDNNKGNLNEILVNLEKTAKETNLLISEIRSTLENVQSLTSTDNQGLVEVMENLQITSQNLEEFSRIIKEQPWLLVRKAAPPERKIP